MYYEFLMKRISPLLGVGIDKKFAGKYQKVLEATDDYKDIGKAILEAGYDTNKRYARGY
jgi:flagellum-specific peptidoglycan hydrolase FlgJ